ncbi:MAG TPA: FAD-binding oxidoreductase [Plantibacter sp.]|uniref:FAD-binding oxidoreductase n=1 Tax=unclassified Plantibacter TaxID=2624265 RepID=UPI002B76DB6F|nr:FAD-binding oxidoreductase [Plantibacter sp.]
MSSATHDPTTYPTTLGELQAALPGAVSLPGDEDWDVARLAWNRAVDQQPAAVVVPRDVEEVMTAVRFAASAGLQVTVQAAGHGASNPLTGCILLRMSAFTTIGVDPTTRTATVGAGITWGELLPALDGTGLIALAGSNPNVSVAGYLLTGGHSWFSRRDGIAAHSIRSVDLVDASGEFRHIEAEHQPELLWALRGAGIDLGVVVSIDIDLPVAPVLTGGKLVFDGALARQVLTTVAEIGASSGPELSLFATVVRMPDIEVVPPPLRGRLVTTVDLVLTGPADEADALIAPLRALGTPMLDTVAPFPIGRLAAISAEPVEPSASRGWAGFAEKLTPGLIDAMITIASPTNGSAASFAQVRILGGAVAHLDGSDDGIAGTVDGGVLVYALWEGGDERGLVDASPLSAQAEERAFASFLMPGDTLERAYPKASLDRLAAVKETVDPTGLLVGNRSPRSAYRG